MGLEELSIVLPCYNEQDSIRPMLDALLAVGLQSAYELEIIFVDDGSSDETWRRISQLAQECRHVRGLRFSRNFGQQAALLAGLRVAHGDAVVTMDSDLEHPPALINEMLAKWKQGAEIVTTIRLAGELPFFKRISSNLFYALFRVMTNLPLQRGQADYRLFDRKVLTALLSIRETGMFLRGLISWIGFKQDTVTYFADNRRFGETKYTLRRMVILALEGMFSFSNVPLRLGFVCGGGLLGFSVCYALYSMFIRVVASGRIGEFLPGWAWLTALLSFFFGLLFLYLGLLGEYLARVYVESKGRPQYIVSETAPAATRPNT